MVSVRRGSLEDAIDIHEWIPEFDHDYLSGFSARAQGVDSLVTLASIGVKNVGYLIAYDRYGDGSIYAWMGAVLPGDRRRGAMSAMMDYLSRWAMDNGYNAIRAKTRNSRREMLSFFVKEGYDFLSVDDSEDAVIELRKDLIESGVVGR